MIKLDTSGIDAWLNSEPEAPYFLPSVVGWHKKMFDSKLHRDIFIYLVILSNMEEKKHWTQKLKEENKKLREDIRKIVGGDFMTTEIWKTTFRMEEGAERQVWAGSPTIKTK